MKMRKQKSLQHTNGFPQNSFGVHKSK